MLTRLSFISCRLERKGIGKFPHSWRVMYTLSHVQILQISWMWLLTIMSIKEIFLLGFEVETFPQSRISDAHPVIFWCRKHRINDIAWLKILDRLADKSADLSFLTQVAHPITFRASWGSSSYASDWQFISERQFFLFLPFLPTPFPHFFFHLRRPWDSPPSPISPYSTYPTDFLCHSLLPPPLHFPLSPPSLTPSKEEKKGVIYE